jgi:hypothetical protein
MRSNNKFINGFKVFFWGGIDIENLGAGVLTGSDMVLAGG